MFDGLDRSAMGPDAGTERYKEEQRERKRKNREIMCDGMKLKICWAIFFGITLPVNIFEGHVR